MRHVLFLPALLVAAAACGDSSSDTGDGGAASDDGGVPQGDAGGVTVPMTWACTGDATACISGTMTSSGFSVLFPYAQVQLYRVFPSGDTMPIQSEELARDGTFAFSGLPAWGHYFLRGVAQFGTSASPLFVETHAGRIAVPVAAGASVTLDIAPIVAEVAETDLAGARSVSYATAHVYNPATGAELTDATVSFVAAGSPTAMPYVTDPTGTKSYYVDFSTALAAAGPFQITASEAALGATPASVTIITEASMFDGALTSPADGSTVPVNQALTVTWPSQPLSDYTLVELFAMQASSYSNVYTSAGSIAADVTSDTAPATALANAGKYLLNVDLGQASCGLGGSQGCAYLIHPADAKLTAQ